MEIRKHYFMTVAALFFLGLIVAKPGSSFQPTTKEQRDCKFVKGKLNCEYKNQEYQLDHRVHYVYQ